MEQKRVSFKVAKAIKEVGYPQECSSPCYVTEDCIKEYDRDYDGDMPIIGEREYKEGQYINFFSYRDKECNPPRCYAPTYIEVWLWLWREKKICINCNYDKYNLLPMWWCSNEDGINYNSPNFDDPEEVIIGAIEYLVENNLIK